MRHLVRPLAAGLLMLLAANCCKRVLVPPAVDLDPYELIGIIEFSSDAQGDLAGYTTHRFLHSITRDQLPVQIVELGDEKTALAAVRMSHLGPDAVKALGEKYGIRTLITGELVVSDVQPRVHISPGFIYFGASADIQASLTTRLFSTENAATIWSCSERIKQQVGYIGLSAGSVNFDAEAPEAAIGSLVDDLVRKATRDFRSTRRWRCGRH